MALPLLTELPGVAFLAITEANIDNYSGMYLMHDERNARQLSARLAPHIDDAGVVGSGEYADALAVARADDCGSHRGG